MIRRYLLYLLFAFIVFSSSAQEQNITQGKMLVERSLIVSGNVRLQYVESRNSHGIPVIFIHGFADSWYSFKQVPGLLHWKVTAQYIDDLLSFAHKPHNDTCYTDTYFFRHDGIQ